MKAHQYWIFLVTGLLFLFPSVCAYDYYTIPVHALTNTPADNVWNYFGATLTAPSTTPDLFRTYIPTVGTIERVEIYDYSGTAGSAQPYSYYIRINNETNYFIDTLSVSNNERIFSNSTLRIPVVTGDYFEIAREHPTWNPNPATNIVGGYVAINSSASGYVLPVQALTNTPADNRWNYYGMLPSAPSATSGIDKVYLPAPGIITKVMINDYSGTAGTDETINYSIQRNGGDTALIGELSVSQNQRIFDNINLGMQVSRGDYIQIRRGHPNWTTNPATNRPAGTLFVNMSTVTNADPGYPLFIETISSSIADDTITYFGNLPKARVTTPQTSKVFIPKGGNITRVELYQYSGTAGSQEPWSYYVRKNDAEDYLIATQENVNRERFFKNLSMNIPVSAGDYIEIKSVQPNFALNPATTVTAGYLWIVTGNIQTECPPSGDIILPPVADFSANLTTANKPAVIQFFDQSNNTVPGTTQYFWNFTDGGTTVDSTEINPVFTYTTNGTFTINHTISSGGAVSTKTKNVTISGGIGSAAPVASFDIVLTDTSTQYPTSWIWNITNLLGNNTEFTYSTSQNPVLNLQTGNWRINLTATNDIGSNTTSKIIGWNLSSPAVYFWKRTS